MGRIEGAWCEMTITTVVFDLYGVLVGRTLASSGDSLARYLRVPIDRLQVAYQSHEPPFDLGHITQEEFWTKVLHDLDLSPRLADLDRLSEIACAGVTECKTIRRLCGALRQLGCETALMSNGRTPWFDRLDRRLQLSELFNHIFISDTIGVRKPDVRFFQHVAANLQGSGARIAFVDDNPANEAGARAVGWEWILFEDECSIEPQLRQLLPPGPA